VEHCGQSKPLFGTISATFAGCAVAIISLYGCFWGVALLGDVTHSGMFGICGPYGDHVGVLVISTLASFPISLIAGIWFGKAALRRFRGASPVKSAQQSEPTLR
jgi:hypothetical protein